MDPLVSGPDRVSGRLGAYVITAMYSSADEHCATRSHVVSEYVDWRFGKCRRRNSRTVFVIGPRPDVRGQHHPRARRGAIPEPRPVGGICA